MLYRSRTSSLIVLLGPIFIILLVGIAFSSKDLHGINIGVYKHGEDTIVNNVIAQIKDTRGFAVIEAKSVDDCIQDVKDSKTHICMEFPPHIEQSDTPPNITFHVDYSKVNLVFIILNSVSKKIKDQSGELTLEYTKQLLEKLEDTANQIEEKTNLIVELADEGRKMSVQINKIESDIDNVSLDAGTDEIDIEKFKSFASNSKERIATVNELIDASIVQNKKGISDLKLSMGQIAIGAKAQKEAQTSLLSEYAIINGQLCMSIDENNADQVKICNLLNATITTLNMSIKATEELQSKMTQTITQLELSEKSLTEKQDQIKDIQTETNKELDAINAELDLIKIKLDGMKEKIKQAESIKNGTKNDISEISGTLENNIQKIESIHQSITEILAELKNQKVTRAEGIVNPINTRINPLITGKSYLDYTFSALLILIVMFMSILLSATIVMSEKESSAFFRNNIAPIKNFIFNLSTYITNMIVVLMQVAVLLIIAKLIFGVQIIPIFSITFTILLVGSIFVCIGMMIGYLFTTEETATLGAISVSCIFLLFSSTLIPIESLAPSVAKFAAYSPFVLGEAVIRQMIVFAQSFTFKNLEVYYLLLELIFVSGLVSIATRINKNRIK